MNLPSMFAIYLYCAVMAVPWLVMWFVDLCFFMDGTSCNDTEAFMIRLSSFMFLYLASLPFLMAHTHKDDPAFLKRLAYHMMYGLGVMIGFAITIGPLGMYPKWAHVGDLVFLLFVFAMLHVYTSNDLAPCGMYQSPWQGHGANPRTFLSIIAIIILLKVVTVSDFMPLSEMVSDPSSVTDRANAFYTLALCQALAFLFLLAVPLHYGNSKDQLNTTLLVVVVEFVFGVAMFWGFFDMLNIYGSTMSVVGLSIFAGLIIVALVGAYFDAKRGKYDPIPNESLVV